MDTLLSQLREATAASHATLDAAFGSLDLSDRDDYIRFLRGHAMGLAPLFDDFRSFVEGDLGLPCPDYPRMLAADLHALGEGPGGLSVPAAAQTTPSATGYVIAGSRLGLAMIRKRGYWGHANALPSAYMEDEQGIAIWREAAARLKGLPADATGREARAAVAAFDTFRAAFAASAPTAPVR